MKTKTKRTIYAMTVVFVSVMGIGPANFGYFIDIPSMIMVLIPTLACYLTTKGQSNRMTLTIKVAWLSSFISVLIGGVLVLRNWSEVADEILPLASALTILPLLYAALTHILLATSGGTPDTPDRQGTRVVEAENKPRIVA